ncbi:MULTISPECIES: histidine kinase [Lacrimispora]|jgi:sensor histidine kinase YesM|uniref:sensor histidine kinase n=1 Tax=Lacrimispora TaxID=2719231 RepID=UPI000BE37910|nr:histidine kinase [Lacrimispora amygdalina]MDK2965691.1 two-component system, sensor histidine kinase YesM [Lacrimispora sp.]
MAVFTTKRAKKKSIMTTLFLPYTALFITVILSFTAHTVINETGKIKVNAFSSLQNNAAMIMGSFDSVIHDLDTVSQNIIYSNLIKEKFGVYINYQDNALSSDEIYENINNTKILFDLIIAMIGPNSPADQTYLYSLDFGKFGVGLDNTTSKERVTDKDWYSQVIQAKGKKFIYCDKDDTLGRFYSYSGDNFFVSLCRMYYSPLNIPQGIVEVKKSFKSISGTVNTFSSPYKERVYIFNPEGKIIYHTGDLNASANYYKVIQAHKGTPSKGSGSDPVFLKQENKYLIFSSSDYTGFTTALVIDNRMLMQPVHQYLITALILLFFVMLITIMISYLISRRIATPLYKIYHQVRAFQLTGEGKNTAEFEDIEIEITEVNTLYQALLKMQRQARKSMERELQLQNSDMQSRMLALQAQMNPHFLYNSLATIQAMADENMNSEIILMCQTISRILRYISSDSEQMVLLTDELNHTRDYLECMKVRYCESLQFEIDIPEKMHQVRLPKLCLQLIVENAIKYSTRSSPPWNVKILGIMTSTYWELQIRDNGPGFSNEDLENLKIQIDLIEKNGVLPNLEIDGMGLMNIYIRFKILYRGNHIFKLSNNVPHGAIVVIGGMIS